MKNQAQLFRDYLNHALTLRIEQKRQFAADDTETRRKALKKLRAAETRFDQSLQDFNTLAVTGIAQNVRVFSGKLFRLAYDMREAQNLFATEPNAERLETAQRHEKNIDLFLKKRAEMFAAI